MDLWMKIGAAVLLVAMLAFLLPRARDILEATPKGSRSDWLGALVPLGLVLLFVLLLVNLA